MEKVCVYKNDSDIRQSINRCETVAIKLQELSDDLAKNDVTPSIDKLQKLFNGDSLRNLINESCENQGITSIPKRMQEILRKDTEKDIEKIKEKAAILIKPGLLSTIEWEFYQVNDGKVVIRPDYKRILTDRFSIYVDTENRANVYNKWLEMKKAIEDFNMAVYGSLKDNSFYEKVSRINPNISTLKDANNLKGIAPYYEDFALAVIGSDGTPELNGELFSYIK
jgi:hypothetical protein